MGQSHITRFAHRECGITMQSGEIALLVAITGFSILGLSSAPIVGGSAIVFSLGFAYGRKAYQYIRKWYDSTPIVSPPIASQSEILSNFSQLTTTPHHLPQRKQQKTEQNQSQRSSMILQEYKQQHQRPKNMETKIIKQPSSSFSLMNLLFSSCSSFFCQEQGEIQITTHRYQRQQTFQCRLRSQQKSIQLKRNVSHSQSTFESSSQSIYESSSQSIHQSSYQSINQSSSQSINKSSSQPTKVIIEQTYSQVPLTKQQLSPNYKGPQAPVFNRINMTESTFDAIKSFTDKKINQIRDQTNNIGIVYGLPSYDSQAQIKPINIDQDTQISINKFRLQIANASIDSPKKMVIFVPLKRKEIDPYYPKKML